jgi:MFS family permease
MRVFQGICTGIFTAIVPLYINETITPKTSNLGSLNQIMLSFGQLFCCGLAAILDVAIKNDPKR